MKCFIDTNILLDVLEERQPHYEYSAQIWSLAESCRIEAFVSAISFNNIHYLVQRHESRKAAQRAVELLNATFTMIPLGQEIMNRAIQAKRADFEDTIQFFSAVSVQADCIITRNAKDFPQDVLPILSPEAFLSQFADQF